MNMCHEICYRTGRDGSLEIDGFSYAEGQSGGVLGILNTRGNIYIGMLTKFQPHFFAWNGLG